MFPSIKKHFLQKHLSETKKFREKEILSLNQARNIGILCEITDEDSYKSIFHIFSKLQENGKQVKLIGYINDKEVPFYCLQQLSADYFCNKNLNWFGNPNMVQVLDFIDMEFDMLIDFNYIFHPAIMAILAQSRAKFIVGRETGNKDLYDLFMDTQQKDDLRYLKEIYTYTQMLTGNDK